MVCIKLEYILSAAIVCLLVLLYNKEELVKKFAPPAQTQPQQIVIMPNNRVQENVNYPQFINDPLIPPGKLGDYNLLSGMRTQDYGHFEKQGFLVSPDSTTRLPLYGRSLHRGGNDYEYYITIDDNNKIMLPNRKEIYANDTVTVPTLPGDYKAYIYSNLSY